MCLCSSLLILDKKQIISFLQIGSILSSNLPQNIGRQLYLLNIPYDNNKMTKMCKQVIDHLEQVRKQRQNSLIIKDFKIIRMKFQKLAPFQAQIIELVQSTNKQSQQIEKDFPKLISPEYLSIDNQQQAIDRFKQAFSVCNLIGNHTAKLLMISQKGIKIKDVLQSINENLSRLLGSMEQVSLHSLRDKIMEEISILTGKLHKVNQLMEQTIKNALKAFGQWNIKFKHLSQIQNKLIQKQLLFQKPKRTKKSTKNRLK